MTPAQEAKLDGLVDSVAKLGTKVDVHLADAKRAEASLVDRLARHSARFTKLEGERSSRGRSVVEWARWIVTSLVALFALGWTIVRGK